MVRIGDLQIDGIRVDKSPPVNNYTVRFNDGVIVAISRATADRYSKYDGCLFTAWESNEEYHEEVADESADLPEKIESSEVYPTKEASKMDERIELIVEAAP